jgi:GTPase SAR1 family protein
MIVGQGRAGKTALANSIMGKSYSETTSTIGIEKFTCDVKFASFNKEGKSWENYEKPEREFEMAIANMLIQNKNSGSSSGEQEKSTEKDNVTKRPESTEVEMRENDSLETATKESFPSKFKTMIHSNSQSNGELLLDHCPHEPPQQLVTTSNALLLNNYSSTPRPLPDSLIDNDILMKCLSNQIQSISNSKFIISLYDFGGQSIFNVIHPFFLTKYGIYLIVFNMEWLIPPSTVNQDDSELFEKTKMECISFLKFWINSIILHTYDPETREVASVIFIGTRKDKVASPNDHQKISLILSDLFSNSIIWPFVVENPFGMNANGRNALWFFPINNTLSTEDETLQQLLQVVEETTSSFPFVHQEISLSIFQLLDKIQQFSTHSSYIGYDEMLILARNTLSSSTETTEMISEELIQQVLTFLHEMGILFYYSSHPILSKIIILNPIDYFIKPATTIICKHVPSVSDSTLHLLDIHKSMRKKYFYEWKEMIERGIISSELLTGLLQDYSQENSSVIIELMMKYSLLVPYQKKIVQEASETNKNLSYLCPSLLPLMDFHSLSPDRRTSSESCTIQNNGLKWENSFLFFFSLSLDSSNDSSSSSSFNPQDLVSEGFLPQGFYERFICKLITQLFSEEKDNSEPGATSSVAVSHYEFYKNYSLLSYNNQYFQILYYENYNCLWVDIEGKNSFPIYCKLYGELRQTISFENLKSLSCIPLVPYNTLSSAGPVTERFTKETIILKLSKILDFFGVDQEKLLNPYSSTSTTTTAKQVGKKNELIFSIPGSRALFSKKEIFDFYPNWTPEGCNVSSAPVIYDIFLSYRWNEFDSHFVECFYDFAPLQHVTKEKRSLRIFLDKKRLVEGKEFSQDFISALFRTKIVIPIISYDALRRLFTLQEDSPVDNLLLEWILALNCFLLEQEQQQQHPQQQRNHATPTASGDIIFNPIFIQRILPVFVGSVEFSNQNGLSKVNNLFAENILSQLPSIIPKATMSKAEEVFLNYQVPFLEEVQELTVVQIIQKLLGFLGIPLWEFFDKKKSEKQDLTSLTIESLIHQSIQKTITSLNLLEDEVKSTLKSNYRELMAPKETTASKAEENREPEHLDEDTDIYSVMTPPISSTITTAILPITKTTTLVEPGPTASEEPPTITAEDYVYMNEVIQEKISFLRSIPARSTSSSSSSNPVESTATTAEVIHAYFLFQYYLQRKELEKAKEFFPILDGIDVKTLILPAFPTKMDYEKHLKSIFEEELCELQRFLMEETMSNPSLFPLLLEVQENLDYGRKLLTKFQNETNI